MQWLQALAQCFSTSHSCILLRTTGTILCYTVLIQKSHTSTKLTVCTRSEVMAAQLPAVRGHDWGLGPAQAVQPQHAVQLGPLGHPGCWGHRRPEGVLCSLLAIPENAALRWRLDSRLLCHYPGCQWVRCCLPPELGSFGWGDDLLRFALLNSCVRAGLGLPALPLLGWLSQRALAPAGPGCLLRQLCRQDLGCCCTPGCQLLAPELCTLLHIAGGRSSCFGAPGGCSRLQAAVCQACQLMNKPALGYRGALPGRAASSLLRGAVAGAALRVCLS